MARPMTAAQMRSQMKKWGVQFREYPGWTTRHRPGAFSDMRGIIIHHTGSDAQSDSYLDWIFTEGRASEGIPAPLCHVSTDFDGDVHLGALGRANHAGKGSSATLAKVTSENWAGRTSEAKPGADDTDGNAHFYGNEVRYDGGQPMDPRQYASSVRWSAAICDFYGWSAMAVIGHREWSRRKGDPGKCPMDKFRRDLTALLAAGAGNTNPTEDDDMAVGPNDVIGADSDGTPLTMAELGARVNYLYNSVLEGGKLDKTLDAINARLTNIEAELDS